MRKLIYIIDDDELMAKCLARSLSVVKNTTTKIFHNIPEVISALDDEKLPDLISGSSDLLGWKDSNLRSDGVRVRCLTAWRQPIVLNNVRYYTCTK